MKLPAWMLAEWMAYDLIDPFGEDRGDLRAGIICQQVIAPHLKKGAKAPKPTDFMPDFTKRLVTKVQTPAEMWQMLMLHKAACDANVKRA
jgi:hypothetical protein